MRPSRVLAPPAEFPVEGVRPLPKRPPSTSSQPTGTSCPNARNLVERADVPEVVSDPYLSLQIRLRNAS